MYRLPDLSVDDLDVLYGMERRPCTMISLSRAELWGVGDAIQSLERRIRIAKARSARKIALWSSPELGELGLAKQWGYPGPVSLIRTVWGVDAFEALRLIELGTLLAQARAAITARANAARAASAVRPGPAACVAGTTYLTRAPAASRG